MIIRQTIAILWEAQLALRSRKLFWITLVLSALVAAVPATIGITETGLTLIGFSFDNPVFNLTTLQDRAILYKLIFASIAIPIWLTWIATILALVSTAGIIPDAIADGAIELSVSKPVGRARWLLTKYVGGLLFAAAQVFLFCLVSFLVIGIKGDAWEPAIFLAVPIVVIFFSYLYSVTTLLGVLTRSTMASLMLTILLWFVIWAVQTTEQSFLFFKIQYEMTIERAEERQELARGELERMRGELAGLDPESAAAVRLERRIQEGTAFLEERSAETIESAQNNLSWLEPTHTGMFAAMTVLPKTGETIALLERWLIDRSELPGGNDEQEAPELAAMFEDPSGRRDPLVVPQDEISEALVEEIQSRSIWWVLGTSLGFEAVILGIACWRFSRRDF